MKRKFSGNISFAYKTVKREPKIFSNKIEVVISDTKTKEAIFSVVVGSNALTTRQLKKICANALGKANYINVKIIYLILDFALQEQKKPYYLKLNVLTKNPVYDKFILTGGIYL